MKRSVLLILACLAGCAAPQKDDYVKYVQQTKGTSLLTAPALVILADGQVDFRGDYDTNDAFNHNGVLYAGDAGLAGLLAQVAVHAAISGNAQNSKLSEQQQRANKVLEPLSDILTLIEPEMLQFDAVDVHWSPPLAGVNATRIVSKPIFFLSQDARVLSLKHIVSISSGKKVPKNRKEKETFLYSNLIEVLSAPIAGDMPVEHWRADEGLRLKSVMKALYQQSLTLALSDIKGELTQHTQAETFKLDLFDKLRIERGNKISEGCQQLVIRNLRGWILVMPARSDTDQVSEGCKAS